MVNIDLTDIYSCFWYTTPQCAKPDRWQYIIDNGGTVENTGESWFSAAVGNACIYLRSGLTDKLYFLSKEDTNIAVLNLMQNQDALSTKQLLENVARFSLMKGEL